MRPSTLTGPLAAAAAASIPATASAHSFGRTFNLPVPFWLYAWGAAGALIASFVVLAYFGSARHAAAAAAPPRRWWHGSVPARALVPLQIASIAALLLCIATGWLGTRSPYANFSMTFFWIVFVLGFAYLTVLVGDLYAWVNPWRTLVLAIGRVLRRYPAGVVRYPAALGYWPATVFYCAFIWIELFGRTTPHGLALILLAYSLVNLLGVGLIGATDWFRYCEFFGVFFRLLAQMAPLSLATPGGADGRYRVRLRAPFIGTLGAGADGYGMLLFLLFMLSSTAFDGLRDTIVWHRVFWVHLYDAGLQDWVGRNPLAAFPAMSRLFLYWQTFWLLASPFVYLAFYLLFIHVQQWLVRGPVSSRQLAFRFAPTLLPIALVYNITHYYTLIQTQGVKIVSLASDPFGRGWNLFGTANWLQYTIIPDPVVVWHVQVTLIVVGHIVSVVLAHRLALQLYGSRRQAAVSQLPMLALMLLFTTAGLWILSQPLVGVE